MAGHASPHLPSRRSRSRGRGADDAGRLDTLDAPGEVLRRARTLLLVTGVLSVLAGIAAIVVPAVASVATAIFIGWIVLFAGVVMAVNAFAGHLSAGERALRILTAALTIFVGIYLLVAPLSGTLTLTFMLAAWLLASGVLELVAAWRFRGAPGAGLMALSGVASLVLGLLIAVSLPSSAAWAIGLLVGIHLIVWGVRALVLAGVLKAVMDR
jgi:uncharacterized membrane protein HdeD (DUF308 family)